MRQWAMRARMNHKHLWMSEWGDWRLDRDRASQSAQAIAFARKIQYALTILHAEAWCMWEPRFLFDENPDGLTRRKAFYAIAQFSRFLPPGAQRIEAAGRASLNVAFLDEKKKRLFLALTNPDSKSASVQIDLSRFVGATLIEARRTSPLENFAEIKGLPAKASGLDLTLPALSTTSLVFHYGGTRAGLVRDPGFESGAMPVVGVDILEPSDAQGWIARLEPPTVPDADAETMHA